ncbi:MAG: OsmC family peroxiredoxin [Candidatus Jettenia sp.]|uniref:OsmC-like protein n=1 Tax=Candidatus Jettenia caeni TaxID=247490 RepID=I3IHR7_9BACT|nr:OsmC family protein [Candidatus Jettenia sp. AMX1]MBC6928470.1 OsmC family peroxiredoxin [Candidatus Jettenia sp.]NUN23536.1 OsmC family protein [Candidatus Jettenia caeni]KAA0251681.1 MAG: OsmC family peroxiredoxin [Candidatus Jettenia sp. AMX1]MCE7879854.1 OsmC family peroxiredoxin [Candidatus Jettenia sp. AMX1]MCQ3925866.1 OsmC family peroxiredoxin [Candidatus Jettenia sp.]
MTEQKTISEQKVINGVNVSMIEDTVNAIKGNPELAKFKFHINNKWINGGHNRSTVKDFYGANKNIPHNKPFTLEADEPPVLAGEDLGANPVEHLLNALAACLTSTMVYHAAIRGIKLDEIESELEGDIDLRGFLGLSNEVRKGYENIRVNFKVKTDAENVERLKALSKLSPVFDVTSHGTNVTVQIEKK